MDWQVYAYINGNTDNAEYGTLVGEKKMCALMLTAGRDSSCLFFYI